VAPGSEIKRGVTPSCSLIMEIDRRKMIFFWNVTSFSLVHVGRCVRGAYCLQGDLNDGGSKSSETSVISTRLHGAISQKEAKAAIFILAAVRTSNVRQKQVINESRCIYS
jgi:hypothetical protein